MSPAAPARARAAWVDSGSTAERWAPERWAASGRASLRLVATRPLTVGRLPFAILVGSILAVGLVVLLLLHTLAAQDAFRLQDMQHQQAALDDVEQELALAEQQREAPAQLAERARALGMVPTGSIAFVRPNHHGKIVGVVRPAAVPAPAPVATATPAAKPSAKPSADDGQRAAAKPDQKPAGHRPSATEHHRRGTDKPGG